MTDTARAAMRDLSDKLSGLSARAALEKRELTEAEQEQATRYQKGIDKLVPAAEAERAEQLALIGRMAENPNNVIEVGGPTRETKPSGLSRDADDALRAVERSGLTGRAADNLDTIIRSGDRDAAAYIRAVADPAYAAGWRKIVRDPVAAAIELTPAEREAVIAVRAVNRDMAISPSSSGGYALPMSIDPTLILTNDGSTNPIRQIARVIQTTQKTHKLVSTEGVQAAYGAEGSNVTEVSPTLVQPEIIAERATAYVELSFELFADWSGVQPELARVFQDAKDNLEAESFISGSGNDAPIGLIVGLAAEDTAPAAVADFTAQQEALGARYQANARWLMNLSALNAASQLVAAADTSDAPIFDAAGNLLRKPVSEASYMNGTDVIYGDFRAGYAVVDRLGMSVEVVPHVFDGSGNLRGVRGMLAIWRSGGAVINANALVYYGAGS